MSIRQRPLAAATPHPHSLQDVLGVQNPSHIGNPLTKWWNTLGENSNAIEGSYIYLNKPPKMLHYKLPDRPKIAFGLDPSHQAGTQTLKYNSNKELMTMTLSCTEEGKIDNISLTPLVPTYRDVNTME